MNTFAPAAMTTSLDESGRILLPLLRQGDLLPGCSIPEFPPDFDLDASTILLVQVDRADLIVIAQSCDLAHGGLSLVACVPSGRFPPLRRRKRSTAARDRQLPGETSATMFVRVVHPLCICSPHRLNRLTSARRSLSISGRSIAYRLAT